MIALKEIEELNSIVEKLNYRYGVFGDRVYFIDKPTVSLRFGLMFTGNVRPALAEFNEKCHTTVTVGTIEAKTKQELAEALYNQFHQDMNRSKITLIYVTSGDSMYYTPSVPGNLCIKFARIPA
jgi:hypothetical protein